MSKDVCMCCSGLVGENGDDHSLMVLNNHNFYVLVCTLC
jgi:hypothetical protein